ncbi:MAG: hypothetical protein WAN46_21110 [Gammaproteobacteria bacterium]
MTALEERQHVVALVTEAMTAGARQDKACARLGWSVRTLQRWQVGQTVRPDYPLRPFADLTAARQWVTGLVSWYNHEHRHSAMRFVTPAQRHAGLDGVLLNQRQAVYAAARARHPQRWRRATRNWEPIQVVHLNPDQADAKVNDPKKQKTDIKKAA